MKYEFIAQPAGIMGPAITRVSFCTYLLKFVGTDKRKKQTFWFIIVSQLIVNGATMIEVFISCEHFSSLWDPSVKGRCWSPLVQAYFGFFQGAWNSVTDLVLTFLPFLILRNLNMKISTRVALSVIMGMSIFAMAACIVKTIELKYIGERMDFTYDTSRFVIWFTTEQYVVIIAASIPTLRPLVLRIARDINSAKTGERWTRSLPRPSNKNASSSQKSSNSNAIRLQVIKDGDTLELERPFVRTKPEAFPPPGTIRKTMSVCIASRRASINNISGLEETSDSPARPVNVWDSSFNDRFAKSNTSP